MNRHTHTVKTLLGASVLATAMLAGGAAGARQLAATEPPSPATGHSEVVATWLVDFEDGAYEWNVTEHTVDATGIDLTHSTPTFLIGDGDYSTAITGPEVRARLADGEVLFRRPTLTTHAAALGTDPATLMEWTITTSPGPDSAPGSDPIEPGAGTHDIDIIRDWLPAGETLTMRAGIPAFVMVTSGWVTTADGTRIDAGGWATLQGDITLTNGGQDPAVLLATWISPVLELTGAPTTTTTAAPTTTVPPTTAAPTTAAPTTTPAPATTVAPPATVAPVTTIAATPTTVWETTTTVWEPTTTTEWTPETTEPVEPLG